MKESKLLKLHKLFNKHSPRYIGPYNFIDIGTFYLGYCSCGMFTICRSPESNEVLINVSADPASKIYVGGHIEDTGDKKMIAAWRRYQRILETNNINNHTAYWRSKDPTDD